MPNRFFPLYRLADANILLASQIFTIQLDYANFHTYRRVIPMMNKRLVNTVPESKKYIAANVAFQWLGLLANIAVMTAIATFLQALYLGQVTQTQVLATAAVVLAGVGIRFGCTLASSAMGCRSSRAVKKTLRSALYRKLLSLGSSFRQQVSTSQAVQVAVEGVEQLETYFGSYLPQLFYAMLAPLTLFVVLAPISLGAAAVLFVCVPLIPVSIILVQRWAKKLLSKYWGEYTALGDTFLENLQGLTTTKIYQTDGLKQAEMNVQAERFRKITMKVLTMQLNSITIMDLVAYGGAALGAVLGLLQLRDGTVSLFGCLMILLLSADFFLPMRLLGSFFHIAMNGMAAWEKMEGILDLQTPVSGTRKVPEGAALSCRELSFSYDPERQVLQNVTLDFPRGSFTAIVGESGCGKSTLASLLMGRNTGFTGSLTLGGIPLEEISQESLLQAITYIGHQSYLFKGTVRENLAMACPEATDEAMWAVLEQVKLSDFLRQEQGLDTLLQERGANLSGGQCQRLALARGLLHDSPIYIFDEATSNIDADSENHIVSLIQALAGKKTVIMISHRLASIREADNICVLEKGRVAESGTHRMLLDQKGVYARLYTAQQELETYAQGGVAL